MGALLQRSRNSSDVLQRKGGGGERGRDGPKLIALKDVLDHKRLEPFRKVKEKTAQGGGGLR
jgi:hypothetical protein